MPTVLELCGVAPPKTVGKSWAPLLRGQEAACHEAVYSSCHSGKGPGRIDYVPSHITVTVERYSAIFGRKPHEAELYDRAADPEQVKNIAAEKPALVTDLRARLVNFMRQQGAEVEYIRTYAQGT
jgi:arylsulfatase A-like enzyme